MTSGTQAENAVLRSDHVPDLRGPEGRGAVRLPGLRRQLRPHRAGFAQAGAQRSTCSGPLAANGPLPWGVTRQSGEAVPYRGLRGGPVPRTDVGGPFPYGCREQSLGHPAIACERAR